MNIEKNQSTSKGQKNSNQFSDKKEDQKSSKQFGQANKASFSKEKNQQDIKKNR